MSTDNAPVAGSIDAEYRLGRPVETYLTVREHARLLIVRGRLQDSKSYREDAPKADTCR